MGTRRILSRGGQWGDMKDGSPPAGSRASARMGVWGEAPRSWPHFLKIMLKYIVCWDFRQHLQDTKTQHFRGREEGGAGGASASLTHGTIRYKDVSSFLKPNFPIPNIGVDWWPWLTLSIVIAVILRYFTEFGKPVMSQWLKLNRCCLQQKCSLENLVFSRGGSKGGQGWGHGPPVKILPPCGSPMKFIIKHNLPLVRGGSLWQYRSVPPAAIMATPLALKM